jgi:hypothetical protein
MIEAIVHETRQGLDGDGLRRENGGVNVRSIGIALAAAGAVFAVALLTTPAGADVPPDNVFPLFALLLMLESLAFGVGVAYVVRARRTLFGPGIGPLARGVAWCVAYLLLASWPHDYLHRITHINGVFNWPALAGIEYVFHFGIVPVGLLVGIYLLRAREVGRAV